MLPNIKLGGTKEVKEELESFGKDYYKEIYENSLENIIENPQILTSDQLLETVEAGGGWVWALFPPRFPIPHNQKNSNLWPQSWLKTLLTPTADEPNHRKVPIYLMYLSGFGDGWPEQAWKQDKFQFFHADFVSDAAIKGPNFAEFINSKKTPIIQWGDGYGDYKFSFREYMNKALVSRNPVFLSAEPLVKFQFMNWASNPFTKKKV